MELFPQPYQFQDVTQKDPEFKEKMEAYKARKHLGVPKKDNPKPQEKDITILDPKRKHL